MRLPAELHAAISEAADKHDILTLRLACKALCNASDDAFIRAFFTERKHLLTYDSLRALVEITAQPRLVKSIKRLAIVSVDIDKSAYMNYHPITDVPPGHPAWRKIFNVREVRAAELRKLTDGGTDVKLLGQALQKLKTAGMIPEIELSARFDNSQDQDNLSAYHGLATLRRKFKMQVPLDLFVGGSCATVTNTALRALHSPSFPVQKLRIVCDNQESSFTDDGMFDIGELISTPERTPLATLKSFHLEMTRNFRRWTNFGRFERMGKLFRTASALEELSVTVQACGMHESGHFSYGCNWLIGCRKPFRFAPLRKISLHGMRASATSYAEFLSPFAKTIQALILRDCCVPPHDCWTTVFRWISANAVELRHAAFEGLKREGDIVSCTAESELLLKGASQMKKQMQELSEGLAYHTIHSDDSVYDGSDGGEFTDVEDFYYDQYDHYDEGDDFKHE